MHQLLESILLTLYSELLHTLVKAVHTLYQDKADFNEADVKSVTTHAILESLGLIEPVDADLEDGFKYTTQKDTRSPLSYSNSPLSQIFTSPECPSRSDTLSSISYQSITGGGDLVEPVEYMTDPQTASTDVPLLTPPLWRPLPTLKSGNDFQSFEPFHPMLPLFGTELLEEMTLPSSTWTTDIAPTIPSQNDNMSAMFSGLPFCHAQVAEIGSPERSQLEAARETFGFDPTSPSPKHSAVETSNEWSSFAKHTKRGSCGTVHSDLESCICASAFPGTHAWMEADLSTMTTDLLLHSGTTSPKVVDPKPRSERSSVSLPPKRRKGRPRLELGELSDPDFVSAPRVRKRGNKRNNYTASAGPHVSESEKRRLSLEQNRRAASKCRERKRREIDQLKEVSHDTAAENRFLKQQTTRLQKESESLRLELLVHMSQRDCQRPDELKRLLDASMLQEVRQISGSEMRE